MKNFPRLILVLIPIFVSLACNFGVAPATQVSPLDIPTFTPPPAVATTESVPTIPPSIATLPAPAVTGALDPRSIADCDIFIDAELANSVGVIPETKFSLSESGKQSCQYNFPGGATVLVYIVTSVSGEEGYGNVMSFSGMFEGVIEPVEVGDEAVFKIFSGTDRVGLEAIINGWYVYIEEQGLDRKHLVLLAEVLQANLAPYSPAP